ncbi:TetR/AcrR family transcriptional regulator [Thermaurantiacus sp.]
MNREPGHVRPEADDDQGEGQTRLDGRRMRAQNNRERIVRAVVDLVGRNQLEPTAEAVAQEAGVSLRTVFRHFEEMENLYLEIAAAIFARAQPVIDQPFPAGLDWRQTLLEILDRRINVFELIAPYKRALDIFRHRSPALAEAHDRVAELSRSVLLSRLPQDRRLNPEEVELLDFLFGMESWYRLRDVQGLSVPDARAVIVRALAAIP